MCLNFNFAKKTAVLIFIIGMIVSKNNVFASYNSKNEYEAKKNYIIKEIKNILPEKDTITYTSVPRGIILSIAQTEIFEENSTKISNSGAIILKYIAQILDKFDNQCTIEAHTEELLNSADNKYNADWEISIVRANKIADYIVNNLDIQADRIFSIGFGKIMPFKNTVDAKTEFPNNRIDFVIFDYTATR